MIGTGVFTSLGFQLQDIENTWSILILWTLGGVMAIAGAFCYAEIGSTFKKSGGEYVFLSKLYHPIAGYLSGWISLIIGFAAPIALAAMALGVYLGNVFQIDPKILALAAIILVAVVHSFSINISSQFQSYASWFKVLLILFLVVMGVLYAPDNSALNFSNAWQTELFLPSFAIAFVYVSYSYTGWNAAAYIVEEFHQPDINLPKALLRGTLIVTLLYVLLQYVFLKHGSLDQLKGQLDIGHVFASELLGSDGAKIINILISFFLISSISAMTWVGPRVSFAMSKDLKIWSFLKKKNKNNLPVMAVWFQTGISIVYVLTGTFESVLLYCGFILQLAAALTVAGVFFVRKNKAIQGSYKAPLYPLLPIIFTAFSIWILIYLIMNRPKESGIGLLIVGIGLITYFINQKISKPK
ncbi:amino acid permease [Muriicola sp. Z0-33]|nr:amino acid permease [Muriicola sp. Z0-33]